MKTKILVEVDQTTIDAVATKPEKNFNKLTSAQAERLAILQEELAESIQAVSKILRHGYESHNPTYHSMSNRLHLMEELGHVYNAIDMLVKTEDLNIYDINTFRLNKAETVKEYLHHN